MMSAKLDWTEKLGDAVLAQQSDVMDAVQRLRSKAIANNKLSSTKQQTITVKKEQDKQVVVIEPTNPDTVYVPYYDPSVVYGTWPSSAYPPYYFPAPGYIAAGIIGTGIALARVMRSGDGRQGGITWAEAWGGAAATFTQIVPSTSTTSAITGSTAPNTVRASDTTTHACRRDRQ